MWRIAVEEMWVVVRWSRDQNYRPVFLHYCFESLLVTFVMTLLPLIEMDKVIAEVCHEKLR